MKCPNCQGSMAEEQYEGVPLDFCSSCGGVWADMGELGKIVDKREKAFTPEQVIATLKERWTPTKRTQAIMCPKCSGKMEQFNYAQIGIMLDRCPKKDGLFFDKGELEEVQVLMEEYDRRYTEDVEKRAKELKECPHCNITLTETGYEGIDVDVCDGCGGIWLDGGELEEILKRREKKFSKSEIAAAKPTGKPSSEEELVPQLRCPLCDDLMERHDFSYTSGVVIDRCARGHGIWLDKGELEKLQVLIEEGEATLEEDLKKWKPVLDKVAGEVKEREEEAIQKIKVSRFGVVNRFMQKLVRKGVL